MRPDGLIGAGPAATARPFVPAHWQVPLGQLAAVVAALLVLFRSDWLAMAGQWWNSSTYNHILLVPAIIGWLVSMRLPQLLLLEPRCWWPGLVALGGAVLLWALGAFAGFAEVSEAGAVAMVMAMVPLLLGPRVTAGLAFPLFYCVFLVPAGDEMIPLLQTITAQLTIMLVHLSQVPATVDGVFIHTPVGLFEVAQACSGVKFLTAMIAFGALAANVCFVSWRRRLPFLVMCAVVPVLANGVRAWGTVYVAQSMGVAYAGGFDHIVYGWVFFGVVIAAIIGASWRFFDRPLDDPMIDAATIRRSPLLTRWIWPRARRWRWRGCWCSRLWAGCRRPMALPRRCPRRSRSPMFRAGAGWTMPRANGGSQERAGLTGACWGVIPMGRGMWLMCSLRSMLRKGPAKRLAVLAKARCVPTANGHGRGRVRRRPMPMATGCWLQVRWHGWRKPPIAPAIWPPAAIYR